ncbi:MAG: phosphoribosylformylglycinamidine cyclo-ligase, partial [Planctomycetota bacterium]
EPLFFLDYVGTGRIQPEQVGALIAGVAEACGDHGVALLGGETAEMPGVYPEGEFDLVGTLVGMVEREHLLDGSRVRPGDLLFGLPSSGLHTNGYSLARRIVAECLRLKPGDLFPEAGGRSVADVLLEPHRCYLETLRPVLRHPGLHGLAHITGGGLPDNLPRALGGLGARVSRDSIPSLLVFEVLVRAGGVPESDAWRTFNMGVGMVLAVAEDCAGEILAGLKAGLNQEAGEPFTMGKVVEAAGVAWSD